ncbi:MULTISPECIES: hypothetical protein [Sphingobacterium]|uniref:hypothetical protein n=1 Tax=Sphingobacterium TaxID=28453 RepID=UPI0013DD4116|nr:MULTISPECIES: hypothetical protein [unclassified Sphingobacterium]
MKNPTELLRDFFDKSLLIKLSTEPIDHSWGENLKNHISNHAFTDPFNVDEQTDPEQVQHFNRLMKTEGDTIKWRKLIPSGNQLYIKPENKEELIPDAVSQLYLQLSIPIFENFIVLLENFLPKKVRRNSFEIINDFYLEFKFELKELDDKKVSYKYPTILLLHNLRLFRNSITHSDSKVSDLEKEFIKYNECVDKKKKGYEDLDHLSKIIFCYRFSKDGSKIFLDKEAFENLSDLYSQLAYIGYLCFCKKNNHNPEF